MSFDQAEVVLIGCGAPLRGMGWYHGQLLSIKKAGLYLHIYILTNTLTSDCDYFL